MVDTSTRCRIFRRRSRIAACRRVPGLRRRAVLFRFDLGFVVARLRFAGDAARRGLMPRALRALFAGDGR
ncbi:hypothetical protein D3C87_2081530 [compost metagenome]